MVMSKSIGRLAIALLVVLVASAAFAPERRQLAGHDH